MEVEQENLKSLTKRKQKIMSGDVTAAFINIGHINLYTKTTTGDVRNRHKEGKGYTANVDVYTMSGDIKIR